MSVELEPLTVEVSNDTIVTTGVTVNTSVSVEIVIVVASDVVVVVAVVVVEVAAVVVANVVVVVLKMFLFLLRTEDRSKTGYGRVDEISLMATSGDAFSCVDSDAIEVRKRRRSV